jgi:hypothetical protein
MSSDTADVNGGSNVQVHLSPNERRFNGRTSSEFGFLMNILSAFKTSLREDITCRRRGH